MSRPEKIRLVHKPAKKVLPRELEQCYKLVRKIRGLYISAGEGWDRRRKLRELRDTPGLEYLLFMAGDVVAAFATYVVHDVDVLDRPTLYLWEIHVAAPFRRHGLGRRLIEEVTRRAGAASGVVTLRCFPTNGVGRKFYEALGFELDAAASDENSYYLRRSATK